MLFRSTKLKDDKFINWEGIDMPVGNAEMDKFEEQNPHISVNVYYVNPDTEKHDVLLYKRTSNPKAKHQIDLLKLERSTEEGDECHYVYIRTFSRLMSSQTNKHHPPKFHCRTCSHGFGAQSLLDTHLESGCMAVEGQRVMMPKKGETLKFKDHYKKLRAPFVVYADFECLTTPDQSLQVREIHHIHLPAPRPLRFHDQRRQWLRRQ